LVELLAVEVVGLSTGAAEEVVMRCWIPIEAHAGPGDGEGVDQSQITQQPEGAVDSIQLDRRNPHIGTYRGRLRASSRERSGM
jgi:hypothetical protein